MLLYYLFWMIMGFIIHFYITLTQPILLFSGLFQCFKEKEYQTESKRNETFGSVIFGKNMIRETWSASQGSIEEAMR